MHAFAASRLALAALCALCIPAAAVGQGTAPAAPYRAPYLPKSDTEVLQRVPAASDPAVRQMATLRARLVADPSNLRVADELAHTYIDFGRRVGDAHYAGYAEAVIAPWAGLPSPPAAVLVTQATILQYRHEFGHARALLMKAVAQEPKHAQAWLSLATLDMVQGDYASAALHCSNVGKHGGFALGLACAGHLRLYTGQAEQGMALLAQIESDAPSLPASFKAWVQGLLAEGAERLGQWNTAEAHYRKALGYTPQDNFLLVAYADFLLDRGRPKEVLALLADYSESDTAFLRLALAHAALATPQAARYKWVMAARFEAYTQRGSEFFGREQARYLTHLAQDPGGALAAAERNWAVQREPWDARVLLEAAQSARQPKAAAPVLAFIAQSKLQDPQIEALAKAARSQLASLP